MEILMVCAELAPVAKSGDTAEVVAALSKTLCQLEHHVTIALPRYASVERAGLMLARRLAPLPLQVGGRTVEATLFDGRLGTGVDLLLVDLPGAFDRSGLYGEGGEDYADNATRFGLFARAVASVVERRSKEGRPVDVVHAHDWPTALVPYLLRGQGARTVLTVHDVSRQGRFPRQAVDDIGLSWDDFHPDGLEFYGELNMLKAGLVAATQLTTVSPTYARDLREPAGGHGLDGVLRARAAALSGIVHGVDYASWSPSIDPGIPAHYDAEDPTPKARCKASLLHELGLSFDPDRPLVIALGPLDEPAGGDLLLDAVEPIVRSGAQVVFGGHGTAELERRAEELAEELADDVRYLGRIAEVGVHKLVAGGDLLVVPHRVDPSGRLAMVAQRYGAFPVVHPVGGLRDVVVDCDAQCHTGTGFWFEEPTSGGLVGGVARALTVLRSAAGATLRRRIMRLDVSWERPARRYVKLYAGRSPLD